MITILTQALCTMAQSSYCWENINTSTTDWRVSGSSNTWNWTQEFYQDIFLSNGSNSPIQRTNIKSPYWAPQSSVNDNRTLFEFRKTNQVGLKDFQPEDGWELLVKNFGSATLGVSYPFFALYNRYSGRVRAFLLIPEQFGSPQTGAFLHTTFSADARRTALYQHMQPIAQPVINFQNLDASIPNEFANAYDYWVFAEFTVAYDPCTCADLGEQNPIDSKIFFQFFVIDESTINATITGSLAEKVTENNAPASGEPSFALNDIIGDVDKLVKAGQKGYKEWGKYETTFNKYLKQFTDSSYRDKLWKSIDTLQYTDPYFYYDLIDEVFVNKSTVNVNRTNFMNGTLLMNPEKLVVYGDETDFLTRNYSKIKGVASILPYVGTAIGVIDLLVSEGDNKTTASKKGPTVFEANLIMDGKLKSTSPLPANEFFTPGFTTNNSQNFIPTYNNILGVFNVLELPKFEYFEIKPNLTIITSDGLNVDLRNLCEKNYSNFHNLDGANNVVFKQYKPTSTLKYIVNPASELEVVSVEAALILEYSGKDALFIQKPSQYSNLKAIPYYDAITSPDRNDTAFYIGWGLDSNTTILPKFEYIGSGALASGFYLNNDGRLSTLSGTTADYLIPIDKPGSATVGRIKSIESSSNLVLDYANSTYPNVDSSIIRFRTEYLPVTCFDRHSLTLLGNNNLGKIYTKLYVRLKHKTDNNVKPITMVLTYDITPQLASAVKSSSEGSYDAKIWGKNWTTNNRCCWKCETGFEFVSAEISDFFYNGDFRITSSPFQQEFFEQKNVTYAGEQYLTVLGDLAIPNNAFVPQNSIIKAVGKITFGSNISIGSGSEFYSEKKIDISSVTTIFPSVLFEIVSFNSIKYNCTNYNYAESHLSNDSIASFCNSTPYRQLSVLFKRNQENNKQNKKIYNGKLDFNVYPNPSSGIFNLVLNQTSENLRFEIMDVNGCLIFTGSKNNQTESIEIDASILPAGVYFVRLYSGIAKIGIRRMVKL